MVPAAPLLVSAHSMLTGVLSSTSQLLPAHSMSWERVFLPNALLLPWKTRVLTQRAPWGLQNSPAAGSGQPGGAPSACSLGHHCIPWLLAGWIYILGANSGLCGVRARCESAAGVAEGSWLGATEGRGGQAAARSLGSCCLRCLSTSGPGAEGREPGPLNKPDFTSAPARGSELPPSQTAELWRDGTTEAGVPTWTRHSHHGGAALKMAPSNGRHRLFLPPHAGPRSRWRRGAAEGATGVWRAAEAGSWQRRKNRAAAGPARSQAGTRPV